MLRARGSLNAYHRSSLLKAGCEKGSKCSYGYPDRDAWVRRSGSSILPTPFNAGLHWQPVVCDGGQRRESTPLPALSLPSLPATGLTSISTSGSGGCSIDSRGKGDVNLEGEGYRNMATATCSLRAINLKIISTWALPILGYTRHRQFQGLMGDGKRKVHSEVFPTAQITHQTHPLD